MSSQPSPLQNAHPPWYKRLLNRWRGIPLEYDLQPYQKVVERIERFQLQRKSDQDLRRTIQQNQKQIQAGGALEQSLPEVFATVAETCHRVLQMSPYRVQLLAAVALHQGKIVEMQTGEGKTLAAVLPACLHALTGRGVHILTFNDYLAQRDAQWMGEVYRFFGLKVAAVAEETPQEQRRAAYGGDITYTTAKQAGFDYLRDQLVSQPEQLLQRGFYYAIVDEADSTLIDEARIPLVLAGSVEQQEAQPVDLTKLVEGLQAGVHYETDEYQNNVFLTDAGCDAVERELGCGPLFDSDNVERLTQINLALHARVLLTRDVDYIVRHGRVELVDEFTGRIADKRRWPDGLQAALEAREGLTPRQDGRILASIALQHFLALYWRFAGMTGTAQAAAEELGEFFGKATVVIPTHRPCIRVDHPDRIYSHRQAKDDAVLQEVIRTHAEQRPVLVGTASVAESELLAQRLQQQGVNCQVLNAKQDAAEAEIIAGAGRLGAVTIATNMAGRGTDIKLGGADEADHKAVAALGGLYILGTNHHESQRIDKQLRGRAGRQGDPGSSCFLVSLEDDLCSRYGILDLIPKGHRPDRQQQPITDRVVRREVARSQRIVEGQSFETRRTLWRYTSLVEKQRRMMRQKREEVLLGKTHPDVLQEACPDRYRELLATVGQAVLTQVERTLFLYHCDQQWAEYLAHIADIREGIHLQGVGGVHPFVGSQDPLQVFHGQLVKAFGSLQQQIEQSMVESFASAQITDQGIDLKREGLGGPTSTWTYIVNDNPFDETFGRSLKSMIKRISGGAQ